MAYRVPRNRKEDFTPTNGQLSVSSRTKLPPGPRAVKKEKPATKDLHGTIESQAQSEQPESDPALHFDNRYSPNSYYLADNNHRSKSVTIDMENGDGIKRIGELAQKLIDHINEMRKFELEHVASLPKLILVGDQSAGKSSLMCALAGIHVPRDKGCCTRCPANIITTPSVDWSCTISLVQDYRYDARKGQPVTIKDIKKHQPFPPWVKQDQVQTEFARLTDKSELANYMRWAQIALLNHDQDYKQFIPGTGERAKAGNTDIEAKITPNVVKVQIYGPQLPALSFFDLPGIISNMPNPEEKYLVDVFENLAKEYIKQENTLIIFAMSMTVDPVLSRAKKVIEDLNATSRCVGVLTKPDTLADRTGNTDFENILRGKEHRLGHGWLVTKQPGQEFRANESDYHANARKEEVEFFENDPLWKGPWSDFLNRCGTNRIQNVLSELLVTSIKEDIPQIQKKLSAYRAKIDEDLRKLPELPSQNVQLEVQRLLHNFSQDVKRLVTSEHTETNFHGDWTKLSRQFHDLLIYIKPLIVCSHKSDTQKIPVINLDESDDEEESALVDAPDTSGRRRRFQDVSSDVVPSPTFKAENSTPERPRPRPILNARGPSNPFRGTVFQEYAGLGRNFASIGDIQNRMQNSSYGLPKVVDPRIHRFYCQKAVSRWKEPYKAVLLAAMTILRLSVQGILEKHLGIYRQTFLFKRSKEAIHEWLDKLQEQQLQTLEDIYQTENFAPFTLMEDGINENKKAELEKLQQSRHKHRANCFVDKQLAMNIKKIKAEKSTPEYHKARQILVSQVTPEQLGRDDFDVQIDVAAYVRGYYVVAANRFADSVCLSLNNRLFRHVHEQVENHLENVLGTNHPENGISNSQILMQEDNNVAEDRRKLYKAKKNLTDFEERFMDLVADCNSPGVDGYNDPCLTSPEEANRSETPENEQLRYRGQSPVEDMLNRRRSMYNYEHEMRQAHKRGSGYVNDLSQNDED
ncbi:putative dynamin family protein [Botrytis fragariae]|uniref:Putative dynamin family protein n=1 Tax=Botrytis fragariae TaxID=1964551 RepID=A0A8H6AMU6_9HELO|nr:putative dynamin family protein [Botrytis fragariae]KAF5870276.1 putative dynamin family protein [Botrytis fragariae]